jgi:hypothetical protein
VIVFICNHCPYVKAVIDRLVADARMLMAERIGFAAICSNDSSSYPGDSFDNMKRFAETHEFPFPYLHDETQSAARAYGAVCAPDFFGYDANRRLKYRGRLDEGRTTPTPRRCAPRTRRGNACCRHNGFCTGSVELVLAWTISIHWRLNSVALFDSRKCFRKDLALLTRARDHMSAPTEHDRSPRSIPEWST